MNITDIRTSNYACLGKQYKPALKYIDELSRLTRTNINGWNIAELFKDGEGIITDRSKINKIFFGLKETTPTQREVLDAELIKGLVAVESRSRRVRAGKYKDSIRSLSTDAASYARRYADKMAEIGRYSSLLQDIKGNKSTLVEDIRTVLADGFFKFEKIVGDRIIFSTPEIRLHHRNDVHLVNLDVPIGSFFFVVTVDTMCFGLANKQNNLNRHGRSHPHAHVSSVFPEKMVLHPTLGCMGNIHNQFIEAATKFNLVEVMRMSAMYLQSYNEESPYRSLANFNEEYLENEKQKLEEQEYKQEQETPSGELVRTVQDRMEQVDRIIEESISI